MWNYMNHTDANINQNALKLKAQDGQEPVAKREKLHENQKHRARHKRRTPTRTFDRAVKLPPLMVGAESPIPVQIHVNNRSPSSSVRKAFTVEEDELGDSSCSVNTERVKYKSDQEWLNNKNEGRESGDSTDLENSYQTSDSCSANKQEIPTCHKIEKHRRQIPPPRIWPIFTYGQQQLFKRYPLGATSKIPGPTETFPGYALRDEVTFIPSEAHRGYYRYNYAHKRGDFVSIPFNTFVWQDLMEVEQRVFRRWCLEWRKNRMSKKTYRLKNAYTKQTNKATRVNLKNVKSKLSTRRPTVRVTLPSDNVSVDNINATKYVVKQVQASPRSAKDQHIHRSPLPSIVEEEGEEEEGGEANDVSPSNEITNIKTKNTARLEKIINTHLTRDNVGRYRNVRSKISKRRSKESTSINAKIQKEAINASDETKIPIANDDKPENDTINRNVNPLNEHSCVMFSSRPNSNASTVDLPALESASASPRCSLTEYEKLISPPFGTKGVKCKQKNYTEPSFKPRIPPTNRKYKNIKSKISSNFQPTVPKRNSLPEMRTSLPPLTASPKPSTVQLIPYNKPLPSILKTDSSCTDINQAIETESNKCPASQSIYLPSKSNDENGHHNSDANRNNHMMTKFKTTAPRPPVMPKDASTYSRETKPSTKRRAANPSLSVNDQSNVEYKPSIVTDKGVSPLDLL